MSLPPSGVDPEVYRLLSAFEYIQVITLGILAWEILVTLEKEITLYRTHGMNKSLLLLSFSRYYTLFCLILDVALNLVDRPTLEFCHHIRWVLPFLSTTIQFAAIPLLLLRTWAIWRRNNFITALLLALWILPLIIGTYVSTTYEGIPYALLLGLDVVGGCGNDPTNNWGTVPFILNLVVDSMIFLLTLGHVVFVQKHATIGFDSIRRVIIRDGIVYYLAMVIVNIVNIVFFLAPGLPPLSRPLIATPATVLPAILVGRLYFNLTGNFLPGNDSSRSGERSTVLESQPAYSFGPSGARASHQISERSDLYPLRPMNPGDIKYGSEGGSY